MPKQTKTKINLNYAPSLARDYNQGQRENPLLCEEKNLVTRKTPLHSGKKLITLVLIMKNIHAKVLRRTDASFQGYGH